MLLAAKLSNLSEYARRSWCPVAVPEGLHADRELDFITERGQRLRAVRGETLGAHSTIYRVRATFAPKENILGNFAAAQDPLRPDFRFHPWCVDDLRALITTASVVVAGKYYAVDEWVELRQESQSSAHQTWYMRGVLADSGFLAEIWLTFTSESPVVDFRGLITWSNRKDSRDDLFVDAIAIETGELLSLDFRRRNGHAEPQWVNGRWLNLLAGRIGFIDGSGIPLHGRMLCWPQVKPLDYLHPDITTLLAGWQAPVYGILRGGWDGKWLAQGNVPVWREQRDEGSGLGAFLREPGQLYDARSLGLAGSPGITGDQEDFAASKGSRAVRAGDTNYLYEAAHAIQQDAFRGMGHFENETALDPSRHPEWISWSGYTHWSHGVSPDRLGKSGALGARNATGWIGYDDQHRSQNNLAAYYALTGDPLARSFLEQHLRTDRAMIPGRMGAPRAVGRLLLTWANMYRLLGGEERGHLYRLMADKIGAVFTQWAGGSSRGSVRIITYGTNARMGVTDPSTGDPISAWSCWEHGLACVGLYAALKVLPPGSVRDQCYHLLLGISRTLVKHAVFYQAGEWVWCDTVHYPLPGQPPLQINDRDIGMPLPNDLYKRGSSFINERDDFGGIANWILPAMMIFLEIIPETDPDRLLGEAIVYSVTNGQSAWDRRTAEWWAVARHSTYAL
ncbi:MAG: hypothetical protein ACYTG5_12820 [Planctomycetota bacterium]